MARSIEAERLYTAPGGDRALVVLSVEPAERVARVAWQKKTYQTARVPITIYAIAS